MKLNSRQLQPGDSDPAGRLVKLATWSDHHDSGTIIRELRLEGFHFPLTEHSWLIHLSLQVQSQSGPLPLAWLLDGVVPAELMSRVDNIQYGENYRAVLYVWMAFMALVGIPETTRTHLSPHLALLTLAPRVGTSWSVPWPAQACTRLMQQHNSKLGPKSIYKENY